MKYDIRVYSVVRVRVTGIDAISPEAGIAKALESGALERFRNCLFGVAGYEYADDDVGYLVDELDLRGDIVLSTYYCDAGHVEIVRRDMVTCRDFSLPTSTRSSTTVIS